LIRSPLFKKQVWVQSHIPELAAMTQIAVPAVSAPEDFRGFSMEDALHLSETRKQERSALTPQDVMAELQRGNTRFWMKGGTNSMSHAFERRAHIIQQYPTVAILGCSDSRVPIEIIFDQGLGDIFVIRVAGNSCHCNTTLASLQYAVHHLKVKCVVVMGHEGCGAVKAAGLDLDTISQEPDELSELLKSMKEGLEGSNSGLAHIQDPRAHDREAVVTNVKRQLDRLSSDKGIMHRVVSKELIVVGAFYEISSGMVDFFQSNKIGRRDSICIDKDGSMAGAKEGATPCKQ
jgi:carbonic anhydrase